MLYWSQRKFKEIQYSSTMMKKTDNVTQKTITSSYCWLRWFYKLSNKGEFFYTLLKHFWSNISCCCSSDVVLDIFLFLFYHYDLICKILQLKKTFSFAQDCNISLQNQNLVSRPGFSLPVTWSPWVYHRFVCITLLLCFLAWSFPRARFTSAFRAQALTSVRPSERTHHRAAGHMLPGRWLLIFPLWNYCVLRRKRG